MEPRGMIPQSLLAQFAVVRQVWIPLPRPLGMLLLWRLRNYCGFCPTPGAMMSFNKQDRSYVVTLSEAKGLSRWANRCFASLSMTLLVLVVKIHHRAATPIRGKLMAAPAQARPA